MSIPERTLQAPEGTYRVLRAHAAGGAGVVWEARHPEDARRVALKTIAIHEGDRGALRAWSSLALLRESAFIASLDHPNVIPLLGAGRLDPDAARTLGHGLRAGDPWLAMPWAPGGSLADADVARIASRILPWTHQLLDAFAAIHGAGYLHLDIKPSNVLLADPEGRQLMVSDFGLSRDLTRGEAPETLPQGLSEPWAAPEIRCAHPLDESTDLFALGRTVAWMLARAKGAGEGVVAAPHAALQRWCEALCVPESAARPPSVFVARALLRSMLVEARPACGMGGSAVTPVPQWDDSAPQTAPGAGAADSRVGEGSDRPAVANPRSGDVSHPRPGPVAQEQEETSAFEEALAPPPAYRRDPNAAYSEARGGWSPLPADAQGAAPRTERTNARRRLDGGMAFDLRRARLRGRDAVLQELGARWEDALQGRRLRLLELVGEAGCGRSRLMRSFAADRVAAQGARLLWLEGDGRVLTPQSLWEAALRVPRLDRATLQSLRRLWGERDQDAVWAGAGAGAEAGGQGDPLQATDWMEAALEAAEAGSEGLLPDEALAEATARVLERHAVGQPLLVILDDCGGDAPLWRALRDMNEATHGLVGLVVRVADFENDPASTANPAAGVAGVEDSAAEVAGMDRIRLGVLDEVSLQRIAAEAGALDEATAALAARRALGSPGRLMDELRMWKGAGVLVPGTQGLRLAGAVPALLSEARGELARLAARVPDQEGEGVAALVTALGLLHPWPELRAAAAERLAAGRKRALVYLQDAGLVQERFGEVTIWPPLARALRTVLIAPEHAGEAADWGPLSEEGVRIGARAVADVLDAAIAAGGGDIAKGTAWEELRARLLVRLDPAEEGARVVPQAMQRLIGAGSLARAAQLGVSLDVALRRANMAAPAELRFRRAQVAYLLGAHREALAILEGGGDGEEEVGPEAGAQWLRLTLLAALGAGERERVQALRGTLSDALARAERDVERARLLSLAAQIHILEGAAAEAEPLLEEACRHCASALQARAVGGSLEPEEPEWGVRRTMLQVRLLHSHALLANGKVREARAVVEGALRDVYPGCDVLLRAHLLNSLGDLLLGEGDAAGARAQWERMLLLLPERAPLAAYAWANLAYLASLVGEWSRARAACRAARRIVGEESTERVAWLARMLHLPALAALEEWKLLAAECEVLETWMAGGPPAIMREMDDAALLALGILRRGLPESSAPALEGRIEALVRAIETGDAGRTPREERVAALEARMRELRDGMGDRARA